jgi:hypothetical protein
MTVPRPTTNVDWATTAGRRIEPDVGTKGTGFVEATRTPAKAANWVTGLVGDWQKWFGALLDVNEEHTYQTPKSRSIAIHPLRGHASPFYVAAGVATAFNPSTQWGQQWLPKETFIFGGGPGGRDVVNESETVQTALPFHGWIIPLGRDLPRGCTVTQVVVGLFAATSQGTVTDRMQMLFTRTPRLPYAAPVVISSDYIGTTLPGNRAITLAGLTEVIDTSAFSYAVIVVSSAGADTSHLDGLLSCIVTFNDIGPRS